MRQHRIALVACGDSKRESRSPARLLYTGSLFSSARGDVERRHLGWWVISAKHGLVHPDTELDPYDLHIGEVPDRAEWGRAVVSKLLDASPAGLAGVVVEVHGGRDYSEAVDAPLRRAGAIVDDVAAGLQIGERRHLYAVRMAAGEAGPPPMPELLVGAVLVHVEQFTPSVDPSALSARLNVQIGPVTAVELAPPKPLRPVLERRPSRSPAPVVALWDAAGLQVVAGLQELAAARAAGTSIRAEIHALGPTWHHLAPIRHGGRCGLDAPAAVQAALARMMPARTMPADELPSAFLAEAVSLLPPVPMFVGRRRVRLWQRSVQGEGGIEGNVTELLVPGVGACYVREALRDQFEASGAERKGWKDGGTISDRHQVLHLAAPAWAWGAVAHSVRDLDTRHRAVWNNRWWTMAVAREVFYGRYDPAERVRWLH